MTLSDDMKARYPGAVAFRFGDSDTLNAGILALVTAGRKTVTCDARAAFLARGEEFPEPGRVDIACDWAWSPVCAVRTLEVSFVPFSEMSEAQVADQGEFRDLDDWRRGYRAYLERGIGFAPDIDMLVERFELVEVFG